MCRDNDASNPPVSLTAEIKARLHAAYDILPGIFLFRADGTEELVFANQDALALYQCKSFRELREKIGTHFSHFLQPDDYLPLSELAGCSTAKDTPHRFYSYEYRTALGHLRRVEVTLQQGTDADLGPLYYMSLIGADTRRNAYETDTLTGLPGMHAFFRAAVTHAKRNLRNGTFLQEVPVYFNITNFRKLNTSYGIARGDECLCTVAHILREHFPGRLIGRLAADNFAMLAGSSDVTTRVSAACRAFADYIQNSGIELKAGIRFYDTSENSAAIFQYGFDQAKLACNTVKSDANHCWAAYTEEMGQRDAIRHYIREHFDEALQKGFLKVYYQPVIRTLTGKICGVEALSRWESPTHGRLSPADFIPVLEETHLIHKLDAYVIDRVCHHLRQRIDDGRPSLPVSLNLSRLDFTLANPLEIVEDIVQKYDLPRDLLCIEITENALVEDDDLIKNGIKAFRANGYQVWLDDFGSGYSSLNVLKDYQFDVIKLDMNFLRSFNAASRKLLAAIVPMAKELGMHTLAEGVETAEQVAFLKSIGCEKLQGYFFGKPMGLRELRLHCQEHDLIAETRTDAYLFAQAGCVDITTETPVAILLDDGASVRILQMNDAYERTLRTIHTNGLDEVNRSLASPAYHLRERFQRFLQRAIRSGRQESLTYVDSGQYMRLRLQTIANLGFTRIYRAELYNITHDSEVQGHESRRLDQILRTIFHLYEGIYYLNYQKDVCEIISSLLPDTSANRHLADIETAHADFAKNYIHPADRERYLVFTQAENIYRTARQSGSIEVAAPFRMLQTDGSYRWLNFIFIVLFKTQAQDILLCVSRDVLDQQPDRAALLGEILKSYGILQEGPALRGSLESELLWSTLLEQSDLKLFWKDGSRRFLGASQAFLDHYGLSSIEELRGKTDEEMGWHIDDTPFHAAERAVIKEGKPVRGALGHCLVRGTPHAIRASKFPIYLNGGIAGLMGYFEDLDDAAAQKDLQDSLGLIDQGTGLMNYRGMLMAGTQYQVNYRENKEDYLAIILDVPAYDQLRRTDQHRGDLLLARLKEIILRLLPQYWSIAYIGSSCFVIFQKRLSETECRNRIFAISNAVHDIHEVDGYPCSLHLQYAFAHGSEASSLDSLLHLLTERLCDAEEQHYSQSLYVGDRVIFQREAFDQLEEPVIISDTETHEVLYCNPAALLDSGLPADTSYQGRKCYELYLHQPAPCDNCDTAQLSHGTFLHNLIHNPVTGHDYYSRAGLIPWRGKNCRFTLLTDLTRYSERSAKRNDLLYHKTMINDALRLAMCESDPDKGIERMLLCIGTRLHAERVLLMEEDSTALHLTYDWAANDLTPLKGTLAPIPRSELAHIYEKFIHHPVITIRDLESYWEHTPGAVPHLPDLTRLTISRISLDDHAYGYIEVVNPPEDRLDVSSLLCSTLSRFIAILLRNRDMQNDLRHLGRIDQLTGVFNRRGLTEYLPTLPHGRLVALVFADVNGLKHTNDTQGHEAGDRLIKQTADALRQEPDAVVFRMGGDEFLLIRDVQTPEEIETIRQSLKQEFHRRGISAALGAITLPTPIEDIDAAIAEVDRLMYEDKTRHYRSRHEKRG